MSEKYQVSCSAGHTSTLGPTTLERLLGSGEHKCEECGKALVLDDPGSVSLECHVCQDVFEVSTLDEARATIDSGCQSCARRGFSGDSIHVPDSFDYWSAQYDWMKNGQGDQPLVRKHRDDYWEGLVHFCSVNEFSGIYKDRAIRAAKTGYYSLPAVCLTEAPPVAWAALQGAHGAFGYVFEKKKILAAGGSPALYLPQALIDAQRARGGFAPSLQPMINTLRTAANAPGHRKYDFLHEREWRLPADLNLDHIRPFAVVVGEFDEATPGWRSIFGALMEYQEFFATGYQHEE